MNKKYIITIVMLLSFGLIGGFGSPALSQNTPQKTKTQKTTEINKPIDTTSLSIVNNPSKYLNKKVKMQATFDKFSTLGLDYNKALRPATKYIGILIQRDDIIDHDIPLSEMKLFLTKELAEKHIDLNTGDKIEIVAKEFSTALDDPWLDIESITVIKKVNKPNLKSEE